MKRLEVALKRTVFSVAALLVRARPVSPDEVRGTEIRDVLLVRQDERIGNLLFITPLIRRLADELPRVRIHVLLSDRFQEVLEHHPAVHRLIPIRKKSLYNPVYLLGALLRLRRTGYDLVIDCKRDVSATNAFIAMLTRGRLRIGFDHELSRRIYHLSVDPSAVGSENEVRHETEILVSPANAVWGWKETPSMEIHFPPGYTFPESVADVTVHAGGRGRKRVPVDLWVRICRALAERGRTVTVLVGPEERTRISPLARAGAEIVFPADVLEMGARMRSSRVFLGPDTGALHVASALNLPIANLFPSDQSRVYGPRSARSIVIDFRKDDAVDRVCNFVDAVLAGK